MSSPLRSPAVWQPPESVKSLPGSYVYLESQAGDPVGRGLNYTYTAGIAVSWVAAFSVEVDNWLGAFSWPGNIVKAGYYRLDEAELHWSWELRCSTVTGWLVVEDYVEELGQIRLRFEQHCNGTEAALHGAVSWSGRTAQVVVLA